MYHLESNDIGITVEPRYAPEHSEPRADKFVFIYHIQIENRGERTVQLLWRHWFIHDDVAGDSEVQGEGVIGEQPILAPGDDHEYESFCVLRGRSGWMEGYYDFKRTDGAELRVDIPRFHMHC